MKHILVVYHSQEKGNTRRMAELVAEGCRQVPGVAAQLVNANETRVAMTAAEQADGYALGSPDYFGYMAGGVKQFFDDILMASWRGQHTLQKPCVCFESHGGGGQALPAMEALARELKLYRVADSVSCEGSPQTNRDADRCIQLGRVLAEKVAAVQQVGIAPAPSH